MWEKKCIFLLPQFHLGEIKEIIGKIHGDKDSKKFIKVLFIIVKYW